MLPVDPRSVVLTMSDFCRSLASSSDTGTACGKRARKCIQGDAGLGRGGERRGVVLGCMTTNGVYADCVQGQTGQVGVWVIMWNGKL